MRPREADSEDVVVVSNVVWAVEAAAASGIMILAWIEMLAAVTMMDTSVASVK